MSKKFLTIMAVLTAIAMACYAYLGGFNSSTVQITPSQPLYIVGKPYQGTANSDELGKLFQETAKLAEAKKLTGEMANIYYNNPEKREDSLKAFIGMLVTDTTQNLPAGYSIRRVAGGRKILQATVKAHFILAPNKLYPALFDYQKEHKLKTKTEFVEYFGSEDKATVQVEIQN